MKPQKRSFTIAGHKTSISLEAPFWDALNEIALIEGITAARLVARIDRMRDDKERLSEKISPTNLSSAIRLFILAHFRGPKPDSETPANSNQPTVILKTGKPDKG
jgi:predicted DNA-binding ribbon-helix-helix protein